MCMKIADIVQSRKPASPIFESNVADHAIWHSRISRLEKIVRLWHNPSHRQLEHILSLHGQARGVADTKQVWAWDAYEAEHDEVVHYLTQHGLLDPNLKTMHPLLIYRRGDGSLVVYPHDVIDGYATPNRMVMRMVGSPAMVEAYAAGGYSAGVWRRWWGNDETGEVIPVDLRDDHDAFFFEHLDSFFTPDELAQLPDPTENEPYPDADPDDDIQNSHDAILVAAYRKGWHAVLYDANNKSLSLRTSAQVNLRGLRKIVRRIMGEVPVVRLDMDIGPSGHSLDVDEIERFLKLGRLPPR